MIRQLPGPDCPRSYMPDGVGGLHICTICVTVNCVTSKAELRIDESCPKYQDRMSGNIEPLK